MTEFGTKKAIREMKEAVQLGILDPAETSELIAIQEELAGEPIEVIEEACWAYLENRVARHRSAIDRHNKRPRLRVIDGGKI
jgi:hypothetical protein